MKTLDELKKEGVKGITHKSLKDMEIGDFDYIIIDELDELNIEEEIATINEKLQELEDTKDKLIHLQTQLQMQKINEENKATAERIAKARSKSSHKKILGRKNSKLARLNAIKEQRRARKEKLKG